MTITVTPITDAESATPDESRTSGTHVVFIDNGGVNFGAIVNSPGVRVYAITEHEIDMTLPDAEWVYGQVTEIEASMIPDVSVWLIHNGEVLKHHALIDGEDYALFDRLTSSILSMPLWAYRSATLTS